MNDLPVLAPSGVVVVFPAAGSSPPASQFYAVGIPLGSLQLVQYKNVVGAPWNHTINRYESATFTGGNSGTPTNASTLRALATQAATDWYSWRLGQLEQQYAGIVDADPGAFHDREWVQEHALIKTRVSVKGEHREDLNAPGVAHLDPRETYLATTTSAITARVGAQFGRGTAEIKKIPNGVFTDASVPSEVWNKWFHPIPIGVDVSLLRDNTTGNLWIVEPNVITRIDCIGNYLHNMVSYDGGVTYVGAPVQTIGCVPCPCGSGSGSGGTYYWCVRVAAGQPTVCGAEGQQLCLDQVYLIGSFVVGGYVSWTYGAAICGGYIVSGPYTNTTTCLTVCAGSGSGSGSPMCCPKLDTSPVTSLCVTMENLLGAPLLNGISWTLSRVSGTFNDCSDDGCWQAFYPYPFVGCPTATPPSNWWWLAISVGCCTTPEHAYKTNRWGVVWVETIAGDTPPTGVAIPGALFDSVTCDPLSLVVTADLGSACYGVGETLVKMTVTEGSCSGSSGTGSGSGGGCCCPSSDLCLTNQNQVSFESVTLAQLSSCTWSYTGAIGVCNTSTVLGLACVSGTWTLTVTPNGGTPVSYPSTTVQCSPTLALTFAGVDMGACGGGVSDSISIVQGGCGCSATRTALGAGSTNLTGSGSLTINVPGTVTAGTKLLVEVGVAVAAVTSGAAGVTFNGVVMTRDQFASVTNAGIALNCEQFSLTVPADATGADVVITHNVTGPALQLILGCVNSVRPLAANAYDSAAEANASGLASNPDTGFGSPTAQNCEYAEGAAMLMAGLLTAAQNGFTLGQQVSGTLSGQSFQLIDCYRFVAAPTALDFAATCSPVPAAWAATESPYR